MRKARTVVPQPDREPWELPELDHQRRRDTIAALGQAVERAGLPHIGPDGWSAASFWWANVFGDGDLPGGLDPRQIAIYAFGATDAQLDDQSSEFGRLFGRCLIALDIKHGRRVSRVREANYTAAMDLQYGSTDRKLFLQAHAPEFVPTTKTKVTIDDLREAVESASDAELHALAGTDPGPGEG